MGRRRTESALRAGGIVAGCATVLLLAACSATAPVGESEGAVRASDGAAPRRGLTLLQFNDTYKIEGLEAGRIGGMARVRTLRNQIEAEGRDVVLLHAGDLLFPSVMSRYLRGTAMIATLNRLDGSDGFDDRLFVTLGNHEFDDRDRQTLVDRLGESRFGWLQSNLRWRPADGAELVPMAGSAPNVVEGRIVEAGGIRLGLLGLGMPGEPRDWADYGDFERLVSEGRRVARQLRADGAELVVAVTHQEMREDAELARRVPEIDRIVGGHEHVALERREGATWITKADADARTMVRIDVERTGGRIATTHRLVPLDSSIAPDPDLLGEVARWLVRLEAKVLEASGRKLLDVVATTEHALEAIEPTIRGRETAMGNFLAEVLREKLATDIGMLNGGAVRMNDDVPAGGELRVYELEGIFYYDEPAVAWELTGAELVELLRKSVSGATLAHGRFLQVAGLRFRYTATPAPQGETTAVAAGDVEVRRAGSDSWSPLDPGAVYSVASPTWLWANGCRDGYARLGNGCPDAVPPQSSPRRLERSERKFRALTEETIASLPGRRIRTAIDGRIRRIEVDSE